MKHTTESASWTFCIAFACLFLLGALLFGCNSAATPPDTVSIDPDFSAAETDVIRASIGAWCDAVGWCPEETDDSTARGRYVRTYATGRGESHVGYNDTWRVVLAPEGFELDMFWTMAAHEGGHWCSVEGSGVDGLGHTENGLMAPAQNEPVLTIDYAAIRMWHRGCATGVL